MPTSHSGDACARRTRFGPDLGQQCVAGQGWPRFCIGGHFRTSSWGQRLPDMRWHGTQTTPLPRTQLGVAQQHRRPQRLQVALSPPRVQLQSQHHRQGNLQPAQSPMRPWTRRQRGVRSLHPAALLTLIGTHGPQGGPRGPSEGPQESTPSGPEGPRGPLGLSVAVAVGCWLLLLMVAGCWLLPRLAAGCWLPAAAAARVTTMNVHRVPLHTRPRKGQIDAQGENMPGKPAGHTQHQHTSKRTPQGNRQCNGRARQRAQPPT